MKLGRLRKEVTLNFCLYKYPVVPPSKLFFSHWYLGRKSNNHLNVSLFLDFYSSPPICFSVVTPIQHYIDCFSFIVSLERSCKSPIFVFLKIVFVIFSYFIFHSNFKISLTLHKTCSNFDRVYFESLD